MIPEPLAALWTDRVPELGPGISNLAVRDAISALTPDTIVPNLRDRNAAMACISGLWLFHDFLDESHTISQDIDEWYGSYWHALMHRREPDAENSKYWWRKVGSNPIVTPLIEQARPLGYSFTNSFDFVDFCERVRGTGSAEEETAKQVQLLEMHLLFEQCCLIAGG